jgi:S-adenosylmethionine synthetase (AdoMet synthetase)
MLTWSPVDGDEGERVGCGVAGAQAAPAGFLWQLVAVVCRVFIHVPSILNMSSTGRSRYSGPRGRCAAHPPTQVTPTDKQPSRSTHCRFYPYLGSGRLSAQYFTVSGSAVDYGEDGQVGRGNFRHGLISPGHGAGNEVSFGKNPTYHVGKVGAWLADHAATTLAQVAGPCRIGVAWRIGADYDDPATVQITTRDPGPHRDGIVNLFGLTSGGDHSVRG